MVVGTRNLNFWILGSNGGGLVAVSGSRLLSGILVCFSWFLGSEHMSIKPKKYMGGCQNYAPFLGPSKNTAPSI